jgi:hypothetical protein
MRNPKNPLVLTIDYDPDQPLPWLVENCRSAVRNEQRAATVEDLLKIIAEHLEQLEKFVKGRPRP